jgi:hypothetical protein
MECTHAFRFPVWAFVETTRSPETRETTKTLAAPVVSAFSCLRMTDIVQHASQRNARKRHGSQLFVGREFGEINLP